MPDRDLLYVEDEDAAVFLFETALRELGSDLRFHRVADGEEAIAFLTKTGVYRNAPTPKLILLDLNLPKLSGLQVLARIHADPALSSIPVVVFTSSALSTDRRRSLALGAREYIIKPASLESFIEVVKSTCLMVAAA